AAAARTLNGWSRHIRTSRWGAGLCQGYLGQYKCSQGGCREDVLLVHDVHTPAWFVIAWASASAGKVTLVGCFDLQLCNQALAKRRLAGYPAEMTIGTKAFWPAKKHS